MHGYTLIAKNCPGTLFQARIQEKTETHDIQMKRVEQVQFFYAR